MFPSKRLFAVMLVGALLGTSALASGQASAARGRVVGPLPALFATLSTRKRTRRRRTRVRTIVWRTGVRMRGAGDDPTRAADRPIAASAAGLVCSRPAAISGGLVWAGWPIAARYRDGDRVSKRPAKRCRVHRAGGRAFASPARARATQRSEQLLRSLRSQPCPHAVSLPSVGSHDPAYFAHHTQPERPSEATLLAALRAQRSTREASHCAPATNPGGSRWEHCSTR